ncbi:MAG: NADH-quinone oxidoreductase subunit H [Bacteroidales bacterium]|nr:NADH-quinone oxidoreductase subunit H [Bacteroidales bacterium]
MELLIKIGFVLLGLFIILNWGLIMAGIIRKIIARVSMRRGIKIYQPYINLIKNYSIRSQLSHGVMFYLGPVFRLSGGVGIFLFMPLIYGSEIWNNFSFTGDLILIAYFMFFGMLGMALGAGEGGHPYSAIGISRGLAQFTAIEVPFTLALLSLAIQYKTLSISEIVAMQQGGIMHWTLFTNPVATIAAMLSFLGAMGHSPFNVVMAPQENPIGPPTEYHGTFLGVLQTNRAILHVIEAVLYMNLFFGGASSWLELLVKSFFVYFWSVFVGMVFPRFRVDQSIPWMLKIPMVLGILSIVLLIF